MPLTITHAADPVSWDAFLRSRRFRPFLQNWTMGEVYRDVGQEPLRLEVRDGDRITGTCFAHVVSARRGKHLSVPYGPVVEDPTALSLLLSALRDEGRKRGCAFVRLSPFWPDVSPLRDVLRREKARPAPLHLLAEHLWYLPLRLPDPWQRGVPDTVSHHRSEDELFAGMRSTARNLVRRAEREGVTVTRSPHPVSDLPSFLALHEETRKRHGFVPYGAAFFRAQVSQFAPRNEVSMYLAHYQGEVIAASIHMHCGGETSYHHGASTQKHKNIPASYLLQWTAIRDALARGDHVYNFWGVSPEGVSRHPFAGVRTFKTAFGGTMLPLVHCMDLPLSPRYLLTKAIETARKWRRGF
ncbi:MAG: peptidoglycan bridge formation glycyltransferase FemA/FemB family protein [Candidatus Peribacteraceae bacterium]|nr:peptidoglycan bridge formation glycyltransferase FemA/FemB family protein [Candidatus Peribacteraceae bacterium]